MFFKVRSMSEYIYIFHRCHKFSRTFAQFHYYNTTLLYCSPRFLHYFYFFFSTGKSRPHQLLESFSLLTEIHGENFYQEETSASPQSSGVGLSSNLLEIFPGLNNRLLSKLRKEKHRKKSTVQSQGLFLPKAIYM